VNLKAKAGRDAFMRIARDVDVIVEGFRPGTVQRLGIDYDQVCPDNPDLVYCSISGYGQTGPNRLRAGHDINYLAVTGVLDQIRGPDDRPVVPNFQIADLLGGSLTAVMGILVGLFDAKLRGKGRYLDVSMTDSIFTHSMAALAATIGNGGSPKPGRATLSGGLACYNVYRTKDSRYLAIGALESHFWDNLCDALNRPDLKSKHIAPGEEAERVKREVQTIFSLQDLSYWTEVLAEKDCCFAPVLDIEQAMRSEQIQSRQLLPYSSAGVNGNLLQLAVPLKMSDFDLESGGSAPRLGEHTDDVLSAAGYSPREIEDLRKSNVIV
jgi:crotonobetainyl-CoA:carnitine CoA-transferase CaiB-like acyl-CoA transferase